MILNALSISFFSFIIFLFFHIIIWRILKGYRGIILIIAISIISYSFTHYFLVTQIILTSRPEFWMSAPLFYCLIMLYSHFYVGMLKSVSIRIIEELFESEGFAMDLDEINEIYPAREMILSRLSLLEEKNWISKEGIEYKCLKKATFTVKINLFLHKIYRLNNTG